MLTAGWPEMLNGAVYGTEPMPPTRCPAISSGGGPSATNAVVAVVGVSRRSTSSNTARDRGEHLVAPAQRGQQLRRASSRSISSKPARETGVTSSAGGPRAASPWWLDTSSDEMMPHARPRLRERDVDVDELEPGVGDERERGFVRELLDLGIAHREAERRRPRDALAPQRFDGASPESDASS